MLRRVDAVKRALRRPAGAARATALRASDAQAGLTELSRGLLRALRAPGA